MTKETQNQGYIAVMYLTRLIDCPFPVELVTVLQTDEYPTGLLVRDDAVDTADTAAYLSSSRRRIIHPMTTGMGLDKLARFEFSSAKTVDEITRQLAEHMGGVPYIRDSPYRSGYGNLHEEVEKFGSIVVPYSRIQEDVGMVPHLLEAKLKKIGRITSQQIFDVKIDNHTLIGLPSA